MKIQNTVINFHVIKNAKWMEDILRLLQSRFEMVSAEDLEKFYYQGVKLKSSCHITVDDGDISVFTHLFPLVKKYKIPISIYVSPYAIKTGRNFWFQEIRDFDYNHFLDFYTNQIGKKINYTNRHQVSALMKSLKIEEINALVDAYKNKYQIPDKERMGMNLDQIMEMNESGLVAIGAHTMNHPILINESDEVVRKEITDSIEELGEMLQKEIRLFAYPNGLPGVDFGAREMNILKNAKIKLAFSTESKNFSKNNDPLSIPRRGITKGSPAFVLSKLVLGDFWEKAKRIMKGKQEVDFRINNENLKK
jgi:peptidoglycan/xylan/chitin deacetylase (PgdA/CDA1 family)